MGVNEEIIAVIRARLQRSDRRSQELTDLLLEALSNLEYVESNLLQMPDYKRRRECIVKIRKALTEE